MSWGLNEESLWRLVNSIVNGTIDILKFIGNMIAGDDIMYRTLVLLMLFIILVFK